MEGRSNPSLGFHPDAPAVALDDLITDGQSHTRAGLLPAMQAFERLENLVQ